MGKDKFHYRKDVAFIDREREIKFPMAPNPPAMKRFEYAFKGIFFAFKTQANFRIHTIISVLVISAGFVFKINPVEWVFIIFAIGLVLASELFNTSIESLVDIVSPSYNENAGLVKDVAAGAVLITAIVSVIIGVIIFLPKIMKIIL